MYGSYFGGGGGGLVGATNGGSGGGGSAFHTVIPASSTATGPSSSSGAMVMSKQQPQPGAPFNKQPPADPVIGHLLNVMRSVGPKLPQGDLDPDALVDPEEEHEFLEQLLQSRELNSLVKAHNVILFCNQEQCPCVSNCTQIADDVMEDIRPFALMIEECRELYAILTTPHLRVSYTCKRCSGNTKHAVDLF